MKNATYRGRFAARPFADRDLVFQPGQTHEISNEHAERLHHDSRFEVEGQPEDDKGNDDLPPPGSSLAEALSTDPDVEPDARSSDE